MINTLKRAVTVSMAAIVSMSTLSGCLLMPIDTDGRWLVSKRIDEDGEVNSARDLHKAGVDIEFDIDGEDVTYMFNGFGDTIEIDLKLKKTGFKTCEFNMGPGMTFVQVTFADADSFWYESEGDDGGTVTYWFERED